MTFPIQGDDIIRLIPQKPPFVFISSLENITEQTCTTIFNFDSSCLLCENDHLTIAGVLENIAQSSGCKMGYDDFVAGKDPRAAFIGEVRDFTYSRLPKIGEKLITEITIENKVFGAVVVVFGKVTSNREEIASCRMKVFFEVEEEVA